MLRFLNEQKCRTIQFSFQPMIWGKCFKKGNCQICCYLILHNFCNWELGSQPGWNEWKRSQQKWLNDNWYFGKIWSMYYLPDAEFISVAKKCSHNMAIFAETPSQDEWNECNGSWRQNPDQGSHICTFIYHHTPGYIFQLYLCVFQLSKCVFSLYLVSFPFPC